MRVLITGGAGFIGSHLAAHYGKISEVVVIDNLRTGKLDNLEGIRHQFIDGSITDPGAVRTVMLGVDVVFHLAAMVSVPESMRFPIECVNINVTGSLNVLEAAAEAGVKKVIHASSAAVYGDNPEVPKREDMLPEPKSPYAISKLDGEYYAEMYHRERGLSTTSLRFFNVFGPRQDPSSAYAAAVPIFIEKALSGENLMIHGDGGQTRDFVHVKDVVSALAHVADRKDLHGTFNVGYGKATSIRKLAEEIVRASGSRSRIVHVEKRLGDVRHSRASVDKLFSTGFAPSGSLESGISEMLEVAECPNG